MGTRLLLLTLRTTTDRARAERSFMVWGDRGDGSYRLTVLGLLNTVLHRLGLELQLET